MTHYVDVISFIQPGVAMGINQQHNKEGIEENINTGQRYTLY